MMKQNYFDLIKASHQTLIYSKKNGTATSYYLVSGESDLLPSRLTFMQFNRSSKDNFSVYQIKGKYRRDEKGKYFSMNGREIHSKITPIPKYKQLLGWGEIDRRFGYYDLIIVDTCEQNPGKIRIHHFAGMAHPEYLDLVCEFITNLAL